MRSSPPADRQHGLDLVLTPHNGGFSYEWQDQHGQTLICGWAPGARAWVHAEALRQIEEAVAKARAPNGFERVARLRKAIAIADFLEAHARRETGFDAERPSHWAALIRTVEQTSPEDWRRLSVLAGQRPASEATQREVVSVLRGRAKAHAEDPFARGVAS